MSDNAARFLAFAFASADLLFEIDADGKLALVMGAAHRVIGMDQAQATGLHWRDLIAESDHYLIAALIDGLGSADRRGPIKVELRPTGERKLRRIGAFSACKLPQLAPNVSCVLVMSPAFGDSTEMPTGPYGLHDRDGFMAATSHLLEGARSGGLDLNLELIEMNGLQALSEGLGESESEEILRRISAALRVESLHGHGAAQLSEEQFALVRSSTDTPDNMASRLERAATAAGAEVSVRASSLTMAPESTSLHVLRALRFALDSFLKDGAITAKTAFHTVLENTVTQANAFAIMVKERKFQMVYQPVVELASGDLHHFEALVRLEDDRSPAKIIRMAEELEIIEDLDLAVIARVIATLKSKGNGKLCLAANVSARSLMRPSFMPAMLKLITPEAALAERLIFEVTESAVLDDLELANSNIQRIRQHGFAVSLDDFGAGAASMAYLRTLSVDSVKIDGQYVKDLADSSRDGALVRHIKQLCDELGVDTIAEMVETSQTAEALVGIGVTYGQGWYFGRPSPEPVYQRPAAPRARRVGETETWG